MTKVQVRREYQRDGGSDDHVQSEYPDTGEGTREYVIGGQAGCKVRAQNSVVIGSPDTGRQKGRETIMGLMPTADALSLLVKVASVLIVLAGLIQFGSVVFARQVVASQLMPLIGAVAGLLVLVSTADIYLGS